MNLSRFTYFSHIHEFIARPSYGEDEFRFCRVAFDFFSQTAYMDVDGAGVAETEFAPNSFIQFFDAEDASRMFRHTNKQVELFWRTSPLPFRSEQPDGAPNRSSNDRTSRPTFSHVVRLFYTFSGVNVCECGRIIPLD